MFARKVFVSSLIAIISVCGTAYAEADSVAKGIAATTYVDRALSGKVDKENVTQMNEMQGRLGTPSGIGDVVDAVNDDDVVTSGAAFAVSYAVAGAMASDLSRQIQGRQDKSGYTQSADVRYSSIGPGSDGDGGQYPSLAAAKKIAQDAILNEVQGGTGVTVTNQIMSEKPGVRIDVQTTSDMEDDTGLPINAEAVKSQRYAQKISERTIESLDGEGRILAATSDGGYGLTGFKIDKLWNMEELTNKVKKDNVPADPSTEDNKYPTVAAAASIAQKVASDKTDYSNQRFANSYTDAQIKNMSIGTSDTELVYPSVGLTKKIAETMSDGVREELNNWIGFIDETVTAEFDNKQNWGTIPVGSSDSRTTASIWVE